jgi:glycosyltransferase involved in cell wall biosynthesis
MNIICFANDWGGDRLSKKQVMLRLAHRHRVLWINAINTRRPRVAKKDLRRVLQKLRDFTRGMRQVEDNIWVLAPIYVPFHGRPAWQALNRRLLRWQIRWAMRRLHFAAPVTYTFVPTSAPVVGSLGETAVVYHCVDEYSAFSDAAAEVGPLERDLLAKSDLVIVCSTPLLEDKSKHHPDVRLLTHGVDYDHFRCSAEPDTPVAEELRSLPHPLLGFHGWVADWVDLKLIADVARLRPEWSIVLVGRADGDLSPVRGLANVHVLGLRPYERLPEYLRAFDVALLPFAVNELTLASNPLKLREYLAAGLPVVAAPLPEVKRMGAMVALASTPDEYVREIETYLARGVRGPSLERAQAMAGESWEAKATQIEAWLRELAPAGAAASATTKTARGAREKAEIG